jgi:DnaJ-class molecular chaperone
VFNFGRREPPQLLILRILRAIEDGMTADEFADLEVKRMNACEVCGGTGTIDLLDMVCPSCEGTGSRDRGSMRGAPDE